MPVFTESEVWRNERERIASGRRPFPIGHVIAALIGIALAGLLIAYERGLL